MTNCRLRGKMAVAAVLAGLLLSTGCAMISTQIGSVTAKLLTGTTADLSQVSATVKFVRNAYPMETATTEVKYAGDLWQPGSNIAVINFVKRQGIGMFQIDGVVRINGEEVPHFVNGVYGQIVEGDDPVSFEIETTTGQTASFTVEPVAPIRIKSINGKTDAATIDMTKDLVLELDNPAGSQGVPLRVALLADAVGTRGFYDLGIFSARDRLVIPASAFRHSAPPNARFFTFNKGENWLLVERFTARAGDAPAVGAAQLIAQSWDCKPVTLSGDVDVIDRLEVTGTVGNEDDADAISYSLNKPNASYGRPFASGKRFALGSLSVRGTLRKQETDSYSYTTGNVKTTVTTTTTWQFPQLPTEFWDELLESLHDDISDLLKERYGIKLIPVETVVASPQYANMEEIEDENTQVEISRSYKGTKNLIPTSLRAMVGNVSSTFAADRPDARLMADLGVDGLIAVTLDLDVPTDTDQITLRPMLSLRVTGPPNGYMIGPTIYTEGLVGSKAGVPTNEADLSSVESLMSSVVRKDEIMAALTRALDELEAQERELGYHDLWAMK